MRNVLVTGSSGFIGKALSAYLLSKDIRVWGVSRSERAPIEHPNYIHLKHDVRDNLEETLPVDTIFHLASPASNVAFWNKPLEVSETILLGTINMMRYAEKRDAYFFYASSLGAAQIESKYRFRDCYDVSKRAAETYVGDYPTARVRAYTMRIPSVYGPGMDSSDKVLPNMVRAVLKNEEPKFYGDFNKKRTYVYIDSLVEQIYEQMINKVYNKIVLGNDLSVIELHREIENTLKDSETLQGMKKTIAYIKSTLV